MYEPNAFSERLRVEDARLVPPGGNGFGFDELPERQEWRALT
jgi:hypothetical protein